MLTGRDLPARTAMPFFYGTARKSAPEDTFEVCIRNPEVNINGWPILRNGTSYLQPRRTPELWQSFLCHYGRVLMPRWQNLEYPQTMATLTKTRRVQPTSSQKPTQRIVRFTTRGSSLGLRSTSTPQLIEQLEVGLSFHTLQAFESNSGIDVVSLATLIGIPDRTLARRKAAGRLAPEESERLLRISTIFEKAVGLFEGDAEAAIHWLTTPKKALNGQQPLQYSRTEPGAREVENLIGRVEHGVFA
jgi:putative toxin-antitoxin system antitoxin component (TIGR02293 family)